MIHVRRAGFAIPTVLKSAEAGEAFREAARFFFEPRSKRRQTRFTFAPLAESDAVRAALLRVFHRRCAYCESPIEKGAAIVDTLRPRTSALGLEQEFAPDHYWWLAYRWQNLYLACSVCSYLKGTKFPVEGDRAPLPERPAGGGMPEAPAAGWIAAVDAEKRLLVDPCADEVGDHLAAVEGGRLVSRSRRGEVTTELLGLNRKDLVAARRGHEKWVRDELDELFLELQTRDRRAFKKRLNRLLRGPYRLVTARLLRPWIGRNRVKLESQLDPVQLKNLEGEVEVARRRRRVRAAARRPKVRTEAIRTAMVRSIRLRNFKAVTDLTLPLEVTGERVPWLMLLGENASGKSSILQAVALALMGDTMRRRLGLDASQVLRRGARQGSVEVRLSGHDAPIRLTFSAGSSDFHGRPAEPDVQVFGYGATRLLPKGGVRASRDGGLVRVRNLFRQFTPLIDAEKWLNRLSNKEFDYQALVLNELLSIDQQVRVVRVWEEGKRRTRVRLFRNTITLDELSDGLQSIVALATDIMKGLQPRWKGHRADVAEGLVLIDEIGAHLHPRLKMRIVERIRRIAPRVQFIATTHDPLCLHGLEDGEVVVLRRGPGGRISLEPDLPSIRGMQVDQLLTSPHFGLGSTVAPEVDGWLRKYYRLKRVRRLSAAQERQLAQLEAKLDGYHVLGKNERERMVYEAIDDYLARRKEAALETTRRRLKSETIAAIGEMWGS